VSERIGTAPTRPKAGLPGREGEETAAPLRCQICDATDLVPGLDLGHQPVSDLILSPSDLSRPETFYPMQLFHCTECGLAQLGYTVDPDVVYKNFPFVSGTTRTTTEHLQWVARQMVDRLGLTGESFVVDIGSNDGTLLKGYVPHGVPFLGIDPSGDPVRIANEQGLETLHAFFNLETAEHVLSERGHADAITACGCFAHIDDLDSVMRGVKALLKRRGLFTTDNQYFLDMVQRLHYDNVFHEHLREYSIKPLIHLMNEYEMEVVDVERSEVYGGSITVYAAHAGEHPVRDSVGALLAEEEAEGLYEPETWERFAREVADKRDRLFDAVHGRVREGQKVIGLGAPAKAATVCNYCRLGPELIDYLTEINELRVGFFLPGMHIPIVHEERMFDDPHPADAGILFSWNYYEEIVPKLRARGWEGEVILP
jgi:SAM-dependent methyltransferase